MLIQVDLGIDKGEPRLASQASVDERLGELLHEHPLSDEISVEHFLDSIEILGESIVMVGLAVTLDDGKIATGAAAGMGQAPLERAYFELLERLAVAKTPRRESVSGAHRVSSSNGVALHVGIEFARKAAQYELIERDRILRSWYGGARPRRLSFDLAWPMWLTQHYRVEAIQFDSGLDLHAESVHVVGLVAFPRERNVPLSLGFAARRTLEEALDAAGRELLQQIAFGWGEPVPSEPPESDSSPEFHLDYFAYPGHHRLLEAWLEGEHEGRGPDLPEVRGDFRFTNLTPSWMKRLSVARAEHPAAIPLVFGVGHPWFPDLPECMRVQPIA